MNIAMIGVGGAGGRIVDRLARRHGTGSDSPLSAIHAIDTDTESLAALGYVPKGSRHAIGQFETAGEGTDGDRKQAKEIIDQERTQLRRAVEDGISTTVDAIVIAAGLAGGTGAAVTPVVTEGLETVYEQPVYTLSVLPAIDVNTSQVSDWQPLEREDEPQDAEGESSDEFPDVVEESTDIDEQSEDSAVQSPEESTESEEGSDSDEQYRENTGYALRQLEEHATAQVVFDNDAWLRSGQGIETHSDTLNRVLVDRFTELLDAGGAVGQRVVDTQDVMRTLDGGGYVSLGYASKEIANWRDADFAVFDRLKRRVFGDDTDELDQAMAVQRTLCWATRGTLTLECPRASATHGLVVFRGPTEWLRGDAITRGRKWFVDYTGIPELRTGDIPVSGSSSLDVFVVMAGIRTTPRIEQFRDAI